MLSVALAACGGAVPQVAVPTEQDPDVVSLLPSEATSVMVLDPRALFSSPASRLVLARLFPDDRVEALRVQHGIDARALDRLIVASYEDGDVFVLRGPFLARVAVAEMAHRMIPLESHAQTPRTRAAGVFRGTRVDAIAIGPHTLAIVAGPPALAGRVLATLEGLTPALDATELSARLDEAPCVWLQPVPLSLPIDAPIAMLLARERSMLAAAVPREAGSIEISVRMRGEFPPGAEENFRHLVSSIARTDLGRAIGIPDALPTLFVASTEDGIDLRATLGAESLARGLWLAMGAEIEAALSDVRVSDGSVSN